ncbi:hypothetical protein [Paenibacillus antarcticus]|uniref:Uncharacterized protein n=1 Tax=Paenibacillus antarcticus TaxID=253703 RepID=A0A168QC59_9BACL|nr:hypothetical protein [Paenibacillus antarcticus]OAB47621.1 hypothetical protein PBAT_05250 [Paenibacillus antarcticus]
MTNLPLSLTIILVIIALILWLDWKVLRTLPRSNRWITCSLFVLSLGILIYSIKFDKVISPTAWIGQMIKLWMPF